MEANKNKNLGKFLTIFFFVMCAVLTIFGNLSFFVIPMVVLPIHYIKEYGNWDLIRRIWFWYWVPFAFAFPILFKFTGGSGMESIYLKLCISGIISAITFKYSKKIKKLLGFWNAYYLHKKKRVKLHQNPLEYHTVKIQWLHWSDTLLW